MVPPVLRKHLTFLTTFSFLRIKGPDVCWYQWVYPTVLAILVFGGYLVLRESAITLDEDTIIRDIVSLMGSLVGFYIASLAAVASFKREILDERLKGRPTVLITVRGDCRKEEVLTRRRFLSIVFGYCASVSMVLYLGGMVLRHVELEISGAHAELVTGAVRVSATAVYLWGLSSLVVVTFLGLHYLVERMHRE